MKPIQIISQDVFDKIRSRFQNLEMGDETGAVTIDPAEARFFDFDFVQEGTNLGRVSISLQDIGSLKIYYSQGITENQDDPAKHLWYSFLKEMRNFAMRRLMRFDTRDIAKTNLDKHDFQFLATKGNKEQDKMSTSMNESRWNHKSTKKTSRAVKGATEVIVRHARAVDEMYPGARSQKKNIKAIFIQNHEGERFKYPFIHPAGAFAMAQHVDNGGVPHDPAGKAIVRMSEQIAQLQEFQRQVQHASLHDDATGIAERAHARLQELKRHIDSLGKRHNYLNWRESFQDDGAPMVTELDPVTMETYKQKFTQTNFKEELSQYFPLIHSIMSEVNEIDLEAYVGEDQQEEINDNNKVKENTFNAFNAFEEWADATEQGKLTSDQIKELKQSLVDLPEGQLDLDTAFNFFNEFGIEDDELNHKFQQAKDLDPETDPIEVFKVWAKESYPELLVALGMSDTTPPPEDSTEQEPVAEGSGLMINGKEIDMRSLEIDGVNPRDYPDFSDAYISYATFTDGSELSDEEMDQLNDEHGDLVHELAYDSLHENEEQGGMPNKTMSTREGMIKEVAKIVKSFYNRDNPEVGPFRGNEGIAIDVKKQISEKFGEQAGEQAAHMAEAFMEKLTNEWQERHGKSTGIADEGLARLKELVGNIKTKVEGIGDRGNGGTDFNKNIMSAEADDKKEDPPFDPPYKTVEPHKDQFGNTIKDKNMAKHLAKQGMKQAMDPKEEILKLAGLAK